MPITALYAGLLLFVFLALSARVIYLRRTERVGIGHGDSRTLRRAIRVHGNFAEYVPMTLILLGLAESVAAPAPALHAAGAATLIGRLLHAWGLSRSVGVSFGRFWGLGLNAFAGAGLAALCLYYGAAGL